jgi:hypothetical protein
MLDWLYHIGKWTWIFCETWWGNLIWWSWLIINIIITAIWMYYPLVLAFANIKEFKWWKLWLFNIILQPTIFILVLWIGHLFYE